MDTKINVAPIVEALDEVVRESDQPWERGWLKEFGIFFNSWREPEENATLLPLWEDEELAAKVFENFTRWDDFEYRSTFDAVRNDMIRLYPPEKGSGIWLYEDTPMSWSWDATGARPATWYFLLNDSQLGRYGFLWRDSDEGRYEASDFGMYWPIDDDEHRRNVLREVFLSGLFESDFFYCLPPYISCDELYPEAIELVEEFVLRHGADKAWEPIDSHLNALTHPGSPFVHGWDENWDWSKGDPGKLPRPKKELLSMRRRVEKLGDKPPSRKLARQLAGLYCELSWDSPESD